MIRKTLNASQLQQEVNRRIHRLQEIVEDGVKIRVPRPQLQESDKTGCNWNMTHFGNAVGFERDIEGVLSTVPGTRSAFAERTTGGYYLDLRVKRDAVARYGMTVGDVQDVIESAIGGASVSQTVEGRERYSINVRYLRDERSDLESLGRVLVAGPDGAQIPLAELADITVSTAPPSIHDEQGALAGYVSVDVAGRDLGTYVAEAKRALAERVSLPPGYRLGWAGQFEYLERARGRAVPAPRGAAADRHPRRHRGVGRAGARTSGGLPPHPHHLCRGLALLGRRRARAARAPTPIILAAPDERL